ncbi:DinB family protein [Occultella glacieicola]|uniref:DinB family protein n=1 Tax=Occultella glacieicola TaxID=2518684 RepID=A0ABY2DWL4_9MICO|nr:DinB family protein [Occultella glacieicola]TDE88180.1 DinB family protein [Occultella glacieicola]
MSYGWRDLGNGRRTELCDECGFDARRSLPDRDLDRVLVRLGAEASRDRAAERPSPETWSALEYLTHCMEMVGETIVVIREGRVEPRARVRDVEDAAAQLRELLREVADGDADRAIELGGPGPVTPAWILAHLQHDLEHHLLDMRRGHARLELEGAEGATVQR